MNTLLLVTILATLGIVAVAIVVFRRRMDEPPLNKYGDDPSAPTVQQPVHVTRNSPPKREKKFYGVSVRPGINCCDAVKAIARNRYLQGEAPLLPLPDCDQEECRCIMRPEDDRRTPIDRRDDAFSAYGDYVPGWNRQSREKSVERRKKVASETE